MLIIKMYFQHQKSKKYIKRKNYRIDDSFRSFIKIYSLFGESYFWKINKNEEHEFKSF